MDNEVVILEHIIVRDIACASTFPVVCRIIYIDVFPR